MLFRCPVKPLIAGDLVDLDDSINRGLQSCESQMKPNARKSSQFYTLPIWRWIFRRRVEKLLDAPQILVSQQAHYFVGLLFFE